MHLAIAKWIERTMETRESFEHKGRGSDLWKHASHSPEHDGGERRGSADSTGNQSVKGGKNVLFSMLHRSSNSSQAEHRGSKDSSNRPSEKSLERDPPRKGVAAAAPPDATSP